MIREQHYKRLEQMYLRAPVNRLYEPSISVSRGSCEVTIQIKECYLQSGKMVHGSVYFKLLDDTSYFAANSLVTDYHLLTVSYNVYFLRPAKQGILRAVGRVVNSSRRLHIAESEVFDSNDKLIARGNGTFMKSAVALDEKAGYF